MAVMALSQYLPERSMSLNSFCSPERFRFSRQKESSQLPASAEKFRLTGNSQF